MKTLLIIFIASSLISCSSTNEETQKESKLTNSRSSNYLIFTDSIVELSTEQQAAFDALDLLQTSSDEHNRLYSTFPNMLQPCYPPDTVFTISCTELHNAMEHFLVKHYTNLTIEKRNVLAATVVLAQEEYRVLYCTDSSSKINYKDGLPMSGIWVIPNVLGHRDIILEW